MNAFLITLLNMSLTASYTVLAVMLARLLLKKAPKWVICALWSLVALRLVCPFTIESVLSIIPKANPIPTNIVYDTTPAIDSGIPLVNSVVNPFITQAFTPNAGDSVNPLQAVLFIGGILWVFGMACILFYAAVGYLRLSRRLYERAPLQDNIYLCDNIDTPFILGIIKPKIFLPSYLDQSTIDCVVAHERAHIKRKDHLWKPLGFLLLTVYWFNPLLWVAYKLFCKDMEMACDQRVVATMSTEEIKTYSSALLSCGTVHRNLGVTPLAFGETHVKPRIKSILHYKKPAFWIMMVAVVTCVAISLCFLTNPKTTVTQMEDPPDSLVSQPTASSEDAINYDAIEIVADETATVVFRSGTELWGEAVLDISHIATVNPYEDEQNEDEQNRAAWLITLTPQGTKQFAKATYENIGNRITIWLCNTQTYSPFVEMEIPNGKLLLFPPEENPEFFVNLAWFVQQWKGASASNYAVPLKNQYEMVKLLHKTGYRIRDPGTLQGGTEEMVRLDNGQYYQSFVSYISATETERHVFVSPQETQGATDWKFICIGNSKSFSAKNIQTAFLKQKTTAEKEFKELLAKQREGYELLVRAPENPKTLTREQIEKIFYVDLPQNYQVKDYKFAVDVNLYNSPMYAINILMDEEGLTKMLNSPKMKIYQEIPVNKAVQVEPETLSQWFVDEEHMNYLTDDGIVQVHHMDAVEMYIMKEPVNGKREVFFRFKYDDEYVSYMENQ